jgi:hypothetical protein
VAMHRPEIMQRMYEALANRFAKQGEPRQRDHFLVLAADAALAGGRPDEAERLRQQLLRFNPHHLLRPYASMAEAMQSSDVKDYVGDLRLQWPAEQAEKLLGGTIPDELPPAPPPPPKLMQTQAQGPAPMAAPIAPPLPGPKPAPLSPPLPGSKPSPYLKLPTREPSPPQASPLPARQAAPPAAGPARWAALLLFFLVLSVGGGLLFLAFIWPLMR